MEDSIQQATVPEAFVTLVSPVVLVSLGRTL
jgi:hypothetical protein